MWPCLTCERGAGLRRTLSFKLMWMSPTVSKNEFTCRGNQVCSCGLQWVCSCTACKMHPAGTCAGLAVGVSALVQHLYVDMPGTVCVLAGSPLYRCCAPPIATQYTWGRETERQTICVQVTNLFVATHEFEALSFFNACRCKHPKWCCVCFALSLQTNVATCFLVWLWPNWALSKTKWLASLTARLAELGLIKNGVAG